MPCGETDSCGGDGNEPSIDWENAASVPIKPEQLSQMLSEGRTNLYTTHMKLSVKRNRAVLLEGLAKARKQR